MAEPDQPDSESVTPGPAAPVRPVLSAPLRRGARKPPPAKAPDKAGVPGAGDDEATTVAAETPDRDVSEKEVSEQDSAEPETDDQESGPEPSQLESSLGYRDRRRPRSRTAATTKGSGKDPGVAYSGKSVAPVRAIAVGLSVVVIIACAIVAVVAALGIERQNDRDELRAEYSDFASKVIVNLTSFNPKNTDNALKTLEKQTSGRAKTQISDSIQQVTSLVKSTNVETKTTVLSSAVTKATDDEGSVIMVYGWEQRSLDGKAAPEYQTFRWRVDMTRINGELKMTNFEWVT